MRLQVRSAAEDPTAEILGNLAITGIIIFSAALVLSNFRSMSLFFFVGDVVTCLITKVIGRYHSFGTRLESARPDVS
ncbi:hypothetical protein F5Y14DRAFT_429570, partial [Nemania sp. NC0429]